MTAEDLISTLENLLIQSKDHYDTKSKLPWNYMLLFNVCGKYNFGLLEFLNHPEYFETLKRISTFLENLEDIEPANLPEKKKFKFISQLDKLITFLFNNHLLDFHVKKSCEFPQEKSFFDEINYKSIYDEITVITVHLLLLTVQCFEGNTYKAFRQLLKSECK